VAYERSSQRRTSHDIDRIPQAPRIIDTQPAMRWIGHFPRSPVALAPQRRMAACTGAVSRGTDARRAVCFGPVAYRSEGAGMMGRVPLKDAVVDILDAVVFNVRHEEPAKRQHRSPARSDENMASSQIGDNETICDGRSVAGADGKALWGDLSGLSKGAGKAWYSPKVERSVGHFQWPLQGWDAINNLSDDGRENALQPLRRDRSPADPSSGWGSHKQYARKSRSALLALPHQPSQAGILGTGKRLRPITTFIACRRIEDAQRQGDMFIQGANP